MDSAICSFSAWSWALLLQGSRWGRVRVWVVDRLPFNWVGHCEHWYGWHVQQGYIRTQVV